MSTKVLVTQLIEKYRAGELGLGDAVGAGNIRLMAVEEKNGMLRISKRNVRTHEWQTIIAKL